VGGLVDGTLTLSSAEIYDPASGTFSPTGSMPDALFLSSATLLADGRVLISGGQLINGNSMTDVTFALLYEPQTGHFVQTGALAQPRDTATATRLEDGRVLVAGGFTWPSDVPASPKGPVSLSVSSVEIFDPNTGKFTAVGPVAGSTAYGAAVALSDGRVLIVGGFGGNSGAVSSAEIYNPNTSSFTATGSLITGREAHTATTLSDGRVLVTGGTTGSGDLASAEIYQP